MANNLLKKINAAVEDYKQLLDGYPNAKKFGNALVDNISQHIPSNEDFRSPQAMSEWSQAAALNAPLGLTFIGPMATGWNSELAAKAKDMLDNGVNPEQVWRETMYGQMPDKNMFSEIPDNKSFYRGSKEAGSSYADEVYLHPELYQNYPDLGISHIKELKGTGGYYDPKTANIGVGTDLNANRTTAHEMQHAIQRIEDWARGGSPKGMEKYVNSALPGTEGLTKDELYHRLTGEAQARATEGRLNMDLDARRNNYPLKNDYLSDIPLNKLINRYR